ncbi:MAG: indolepyruvate ferredoxin oxidoreductase family protein [Burkholderiaceae bacterium]
MTAAGPLGTPRIDLEYRLEHRYTRNRGRVFLTGTQALVRALLAQAEIDRARGLHTAGFVSGYRGSPLGAVDLQLWNARGLLDDHGIRFLPAINEELAATAVLGTQRVEADPERLVEGVYALWYGKGPGVDRAGDALRHGNAFGSSPHGGVVVVLGDDHGCVSSSMPHQSDFVVAAWSLPVLNPGNVAELLEFALYGWALSRFSGAWVGMKAISETVESGGSVDWDELTCHWQEPEALADPAGGLHNRWPDLPSLSIEARLARKLDAVQRFARLNSIDKLIAPSPNADVGILTCGKAHFDLLEAIRRLELSVEGLASAGIRIYKVGLAFPLEKSRLEDFARGLKEILVVEEKGMFVEQQLRNHFYNAPDHSRPAILGKTDLSQAPLFSALGELRPSRVLPGLASWLARHRPALDRRDRVVDFVPAPVLSNAADGVRRSPYFCSGCPHNSSTRVPEGSVAHAGIGCHFMASWMERDTVGLIQMGGEGVDWAGQAWFTARPHIFQNLGDGTYFHSGILAIRQAVASGANLTYKILYNDAVAMTGGQPVDGKTSVAQIARQVEAEGTSRLVVVSDAPDKYRGKEAEFPAGTTFHHRSEMDGIQRSLRETAGVTVLIYDQTCAAELRRRRKKGLIADPTRRVFINSDVCEGCGDCGVQSNCLSVEPLETPYGRKRRINQTSCNKDYSCVSGFCPSFVSVTGAKLKRAVGPAFDVARFRAQVAALPERAAALSEAPYDLLVAGVGGTGVVTIGAVVSMAAHLEGHCASVLDFMGFAQKGGAVLSFVRLAMRPDLLNQVRIDAQQADAILACDLVVGASPDALQTARRDRTRVIVNEHEMPNDTFVRRPDAQLHAAELLDKLRYAAGPDKIESCDAHSLAREFLGDVVTENMVMLGFAWQKGCVPVSLAALDRAIELNGVAIEANRLALAVGRLAAESPDELHSLREARQGEELPSSLEDLIERQAGRVRAYQDTRLENVYRVLVTSIMTRESATLGAPGELTRKVADNYARLLTYKDEYEVARLYTDPAFRESLAREFEGSPGRDFRLDFHMAPPLLSRNGPNGLPQKIRLGPWLFPLLRVLRHMRFLRGRVIDPFGWTRERRLERELIVDYRKTIEEAANKLDWKDSAQRAAFIELLGLPETIRGFGHVKIESIVRAKSREDTLLKQWGLGHQRSRLTRALMQTATSVRRTVSIRPVS